MAIISLKKLRKKINRIDNKLVSLFLKRMNISLYVAEYKAKHNLPVLDQKREQEVIRKAVSLTDNAQLKPIVRQYMESIMSCSRRVQMQSMPNIKYKRKTSSKISTPVGYCGDLGSYSEQAVEQYFGTSTDAKNYYSFQRLLHALVNNEIQYALLPIENSSTGSIAVNIDLIRDYDVYITGEIALKVSHCLLGIFGASINDIKEVYSHPQGFEQSSRFLSDYDWKLIPYYNTAISAKYVAESKEKFKAAIASRRAAEKYSLEIIAEGIQDYESNYTRFVVLSNKLEITEKSNKISVVLAVPHKPGALYNILQLFAKQNINLMKIESRPIIGKPWEYFFFFDLEGNLDNPEVRDTLKEIERRCHSFKLLGNYENCLVEGY